MHRDCIVKVLQGWAICKCIGKPLESFRETKSPLCITNYLLARVCFFIIMEVHRRALTLKRASGDFVKTNPSDKLTTIGVLGPGLFE